VVDVRMGDDNLLDLQIVLSDQRLDIGDIVAGVNDHGFARGFVANDRTIAPQRADRKNFVDHENVVGRSSCVDRSIIGARKLEPQV
jgi:hypothetical protein